MKQTHLPFLQLNCSGNALWDGIEYLLTDPGSHQKQALTFMLRREGGWNFEEAGKDVWERERDQTGRSM